MSTEPQLFRVDPNTKASVKAKEVDFSHLGLQERLDLLAVDPDGKLVIIELKRDHSGAAPIHQRTD